MYRRLHRVVFTIVVTAVLVLVLGACGAGKPRSAAVSGAEVFARACSVCHTLGAEGGRDQPIGGSLRGYGLSAGQVERLARVMPVAHPLSAAELRAVSAYVAAVERRATPTR